MAHISKDENLEKLRGSELHHDLKNRPGEDGDPNHMNDGKALKPKADDKAEKGS